MAIPDVTPMHCSIISAMSPIYTMFIAAIVLKEPLSWHKAGGVVLSLCGIIFLIINNTSGTSGVAESRLSGILLMFVNSLSFSLYLGIFKPVIAKYSIITFMKWIFLFSALMSIPLSFREVLSFEWTRIPSVQMLELAYLIIFATFLAYFLIPFGQKHIRPTLVSMYSYVQPIIATLISIILGMDLLTWQKILAAVMVFSGVYVVNRSRQA
jgi:drug/metabolite transporter (DMT)-like permease